MTNFQIKNLKFTSAIVKLTYENLIWLGLQFALAYNVLNVPELKEDEEDQDNASVRAAQSSPMHTLLLTHPCA